MRSAAKWPVLPLTEAFWFQEGPGVRNWQFTTSGIKLLNVANIEKDGTLNLEKTDRHLDESEVAKKYSHFIIDAGDLVIASSGISFDDDGLLRTRGAFVRSDQLPLCLNTSTIRFKAIDGISDLRFLRFWLDSREFRSQITKLVTGTAQQNFGPSHLKATKISIPPLPEQRRIAEILDKADALRAKRRAALAQLDTLTQSIFLDMFGDPATNPKGWPQVPIGDHASKIGSGATPRGGEEAYKAAGVTLIRRMNVRDGAFLKDGLAFIDDEQAAPLEGVVVEANDILLNITGASVARVCRAPEDVLPARVNQHVAIIRPTAAFNPHFLEQCLLSPSVKERLLKTARAGATREAITKSAIEQFKVIRAPRELQDQFADRVAAKEDTYCRMHAALSEVDSLFASLQHRAFQDNL